MTNKPRVARPLSVVAIACMACCAAPVLAAVGGLTALAGIAAILVGATAIGGAILLVGFVGFSWLRRRRSIPNGGEPLAVALTRRG